MCTTCQNKKIKIGKMYLLVKFNDDMGFTRVTIASGGDVNFLEKKHNVTISNR